MKSRFVNRAMPYVYIAPAMVGIIGLSGGAILDSFRISFADWDLVSDPVYRGIGNYVELASSSLFWQVFKNTITYALLTVPMSIVASLLLALLVNRHVRGIAFFRAAYFVPVVVSMVAAAMVWSWLYNPEFGVINWGLREVLGIDGLRWLQDPDLSLISIALMSVWKGLGYNMVILLAGLQQIPPHLYEAATLDGAGRVGRFIHVTLPMLSPTLFFVLVITTIGAFQIFEQTYVLTQGGPANSTLTLSYYVYQNAFQFFRMGYAAALAYVLFALTALVAALQFRLQRRWVYNG